MLAQRRQLVNVKAVLLSPTVLTAAARLAVRLAPGKLLLQAASRPGLSRLAGPLSVALLLYSIAVTLYAARKQQADAAAASAARASGLLSMDSDTDSFAGSMMGSVMGSVLGSMDVDSEGTAPAAATTAAGSRPLAVRGVQGRGFVWKK
ncbi:hypothetical protein N2152v2_002022 [Parachlorella kessleri]